MKWFALIIAVILSVFSNSLLRVAYEPSFYTYCVEYMFAALIVVLGLIIVEGKNKGGEK